MLKFLKDFFYDPKSGVYLKNGWYARWTGRDHFLLKSRTGHRYGIYAPRVEGTGGKGGKVKRTLTVKDMPDCWLRPHAGVKLTEEQLRTVVENSKLTVELCGEILEVTG